MRIPTRKLEAVGRCDARVNLRGQKVDVIPSDALADQEHRPPRIEEKFLRLLNRDAFATANRIGRRRIPNQITPLLKGTSSTGLPSIVPTAPAAAAQKAYRRWPSADP